MKTRKKFLKRRKKHRITVRIDAPEQDVFLLWVLARLCFEEELGLDGSLIYAEREGNRKKNEGKYGRKRGTGRGRLREGKVLTVSDKALEPLSRALDLFAPSTFMWPPPPFERLIKTKTHVYASPVPQSLYLLIPAMSRFFSSTLCPLHQMALGYPSDPAPSLPLPLRTALDAPPPSSGRQEGRGALPQGRSCGEGSRRRRRSERQEGRVWWGPDKEEGVGGMKRAERKIWRCSRQWFPKKR